MLNKVEQARQHKETLIRAAIEARESAYAPYSRFRVGAAVLAASGRIYTGCNVENVSYGLTVCAERVAIWNAVSQGEREVVALAVVAGESIAYPCGACLQVVREFAGGESPVIIIAATDGSSDVKSLSECLPYAFTSFESEEKEVKG